MERQEKQSRQACENRATKVWSNSHVTSPHLDSHHYYNRHNHNHNHNHGHDHNHDHNNNSNSNNNYNNNHNYNCNYNHNNNGETMSSIASSHLSYNTRPRDISTSARFYQTKGGTGTQVEAKTEKGREQETDDEAVKRRVLTSQRDEEVETGPRVGREPKAEAEVEVEIAITITIVIKSKAEVEVEAGMQVNIKKKRVANAAMTIGKTKKSKETEAK
ncbi:hypothetical protein RFI_03984, partial [Reticulomyxa filosa]